MTIIGTLSAQHGRYDDAVAYLRAARKLARLKGLHVVVAGIDPILTEAIAMKANQLVARAKAGYFAHDVFTDPKRFRKLPDTARIALVNAYADFTLGDYGRSAARLEKAMRAAPRDTDLRLAFAYVARLRTVQSQLRAKHPPAKGYRERVRLRAQGNAAHKAAMHLYRRNDFETALEFAIEAQGRLRQAGAPDKTLDALREKLVASLTTGDRRKPDTLNRVPVYRSKAGAMLDAMEYGKGDLRAAMRYLAAAQKAAPNNTVLRQATAEMRLIFKAQLAGAGK